MVLRCTAYPGYFAIDEDLSEITLNFWYILQDTTLDDVEPASMAQSETETSIPTLNRVGSVESCEEVAEISSPAILGTLSESTRTGLQELYAQLVVVLCTKCAYPPESMWDTLSAGT
jgi:hypothetical protein